MSEHYVCGHSRGELNRLEAQGEFYGEITRDLLHNAGVCTGMRVLDIGCGAGDVSLLAATLVGADGSVVGVDRVPEAIHAAHARAASVGANNVRFELATLEELSGTEVWGESPEPFDALIGRFVLMHQRDPASALRSASRCVRRGGTVALLESDMAATLAGVHSLPHSVTYDRMLRWLVQVIGAAGAHTAMGLRLRQTFIDAGLPAPALSLHARVEGGEESSIYSYVAESLWSMAPMARQFGIVDLSRDDIDALERELRSEVLAQGAVLMSPLLVGAWCRIPGTLH